MELSAILIGICCTLLILPISKVASRNVTIEPNKKLKLLIDPDENVTFYLDNIGSGIGFIILQIHAWTETITLSLSEDFVVGKTVAGRDVGVLTMLNKSQASVEWFLVSNESKSIDSFYVLLLARLYEAGTPIPGGCNMEFPLNRDPNLHVTYGHFSNLVEFQLGRQVFPTVDDCDKASNNLHYDLYQHYTGPGSDAYFKTLEHVMTVGAAQTNGKKVKHFDPKDKTDVRLAAYQGKGVVYSLVITQSVNGTKYPSAAYVPVTSYGCEDEAVSCSYLQGKNAFPLLAVSLLGLVGLFICFLGHRFFQTELFIFGLLGFSLITYTLVARFTELNTSVCLVIALICGAVFGALCVVFWFYKGMPIISVLFVGLVFGYLISCIAFNLTPLVNMSWLQTKFNYGFAFTCGVLVPPVLLLAYTHILNLLSCSIVGSYLFVFAVDTFVQGSVIRVITVSIQKGIDNMFIDAIVTLPLQWSDLVLAIVWILLSVAGFIVQFLRERHRAPFPPCPYQLRKLQQGSWTHPSQNERVPERTCDPITEEEEDEDNENEPLLQAHNQQERQMQNQESN